MTFVTLNTVIFFKVNTEIVFYIYQADYFFTKFAIIKEGVERIL